MRHLQSFANGNLNLLKLTPQGTFSWTEFCVADKSATGAEYVVYAPSGGTFAVNLSATTRVLNVEWFNPTSGVTTPGAAITGGSTKSFTAPFTGDAVLYLVDAAGHNCLLLLLSASREDNLPLAVLSFAKRGSSSDWFSGAKSHMPCTHFVARQEWQHPLLVDLSNASITLSAPFLLPPIT